MYELIKKLCLIMLLTGKASAKHCSTIMCTFKKPRKQPLGYNDTMASKFLKRTNNLQLYNFLGRGGGWEKNVIGRNIYQPINLHLDLGTENCNLLHFFNQQMSITWFYKQ